MDLWKGRYVELHTADVPIGWSNHPVLLGVETYFADSHCVNECLHPSLHFSQPRPILTDTQSTYIFEEKGRYFFWNDISGSVALIEENSWEDIIAKLRQSVLAPMSLLPLRTLDGPSWEPTSNIPYSPNPDFVDRPHLTGKFQMPPHRSVLICGPGGCGKSELAINYANKVRTYSPETWVFWLCATTAEVFREDLSAIADILPECQPTKDNLSQTDLVLHWLRKSGGQRWLMVVDDVNSDVVELLPEIDALWKSKERGSFVFTSREDLYGSGKVYFKSSLRFAVQNLSKNEALQLLRKKLKEPKIAERLTDITWTPFAVELAAASLNKEFKSKSEFIESITSSPKTTSAKAFFSLFDSLSSFQKHILYFVSSFRPPDIPRLWIRSYIEWRNLDEELYELAAALRSLTELSLLTYVSSTNAYKMQAEVQSFIAGELQVTDWQSRILENIKSCVESQRFIPNHRLPVRDFRFDWEMTLKSLSRKIGHLIGNDGDFVIAITSLMGFFYRFCDAIIKFFVRIRLSVGTRRF